MNYLFQLLLLFFSIDLHGQEQTKLLADSDWPSYNFTLNGQRFVPIDQINKSNVGQLERVCSLSLVNSGVSSSGILHVQGMLYVTSSFDTFAVDSSNCEVLWKYEHRKNVPVGSIAKVNHGAAYANDRIFRGTADGWMLALNAKTGELVWEHQTGDPLAGESFNGAPQTFQGLVIIGASGGDGGLGGRVMAYETATGREVWRYYLGRRGENPSADSSLREGAADITGGISGSTYTIDASTGQVFIPISMSDSTLLTLDHRVNKQFVGGLVILDATTGARRSQYPFRWDEQHHLILNAAPVLYKSKDGERMVAFGSEDGHVYSLQRNSLERAFKIPVTRVNNPDAISMSEGAEICPGPLGGVAWNGPAFDRENRILITGAVDSCAVVKAGPEKDSETLALDNGLEFSGKGAGWMFGLDADSGEVLWSLKTNGTQVAGITPTSGGITFSGDMAGNFRALDSRTGKILFHDKVDGGLAGGVVTYLRKGRQLVSFVVGSMSSSRADDSGKPALHIYGLRGNQNPSESNATRDDTEEFSF